MVRGDIHGHRPDRCDCKLKHEEGAAERERDEDEVMGQKNGDQEDRRPAEAD